MAQERVDIDALEQVVRHRAWVSGNPTSWRFRKISYGLCSQGWFVQRIGQRWSATWLVADERAACDLVEKCMVGRDWHRVPAVFNAQGQPADGGTWYVSGTQWFPGVRPGDEMNGSSVNAQG
jgi:hypothetical protein